MIYNVNPKSASSSAAVQHQSSSVAATIPVSSSSLLSASSSNFTANTAASVSSNDININLVEASTLSTSSSSDLVNSKKTPSFHSADQLSSSNSNHSNHSHNHNHHHHHNHQEDTDPDLKAESTSMIVDQDSATTSKHLNGSSNSNHITDNGYVTSKNGSNLADTPTSEEQMEMDSPTCSYSKPCKKETKNFPFENQYLQTVLDFGRELFQMNTRTNLEHGDNPGNTKMLRDAFSLLAYHDPWSSPLGYQLDPSQREPISAMLNSAILEANNMPRIPPLEVVYGQTSECMRLMSKYGVAWCAYVNLTDYMQS